MNALATLEPTMSSREIAELVNSRHDDVKRSISRLADRGVIQLPPMADVKNHLGQTVQEFRIGKRDSYVIVAQLSPEFTARLVDRWQELEQQTIDPARFLNDPAALRGLLLDNVEKVIALEGRVRELEPSHEALQRISEADGSLCITDAAKALQLRPKDLFEWLQQNGWIYRRPGSGHYLGYQPKTTAGLIEHKVTTVLRSDGSEKVTEQVRITPKGLTKLANLIKPAIRSAA